MDPDIEREDEDREDDYSLDHDLVDEVVAALDADDRPTVMALIADLHAADVADLIEQIETEDRRRLVETVGPDFDPDILSELEEGVRDDVLAFMAPAHLAAAVKELDTDDVVYLVEDLDKEQQASVLDALDDVARAAVEQSLTYPEDTAGRLMQRELVTAPVFWTVGQVIDYMRNAEDLPDQFYEVIIVDPAHAPVGAVALSKIMATRRAVTLDTIMNEDFRVIPVDQSREDVAYAFNQYHLVSAPVVEESGRLVGVITIDDAMDVLEDEREEDLLRLGGVGGEELTDRVWEITRQRFPWLAVNLLTAILASLVISLFDQTISRIVALAVLMPIVASMGGNAGTQTLTVAVRALATKDITRINALRVIRREVLVGLLNGVTFAVIIGAVGYFWFGEPMLGVVLALAMVANMLMAGLAGILIPIGLEKAGADPALASGTFVTTVTDIVGFFTFLGLAAVLLI